MIRKCRGERRRMARNCRLDLQIATPFAATSLIGFRRQSMIWSDDNKITISYCDATELQAIAILWFARRETEEKLYNNAPGSSPSLHRQSRGFSVKKSLKKFLQKRKDRIRSSMPY